jgi:hypothetical protein
MKYTGKLFGKVDRTYIPLILTSEKVDAMEKALEEIAKQNLAAEMDDHSSEHADWEGGYEAIVKIARTALYSENTEGLASTAGSDNPKL